MLSLANPFLLLLLPLPLLIRKLIKPAPASKQSPLYVPFLISQPEHSADSIKPNQSSIAALIIIWLIWVLLVIAASRPQWVEEPIPLPMEGRDIFLAVDLSGSMQETDLKLNDEFVDRLTVVKHVLKDFIAKRQGDRLSLILFGTHAYVQTPLTHDLKTVQSMLQDSVINIAGEKTAIGEAIGLSLKMVKELPAQHEHSRILVLLSDGQNTAGNVEPLDAAQLAKQLKLKIYTIGVGADEMYVSSLFGARRVNPSRALDEKTLSQIADITGGEYFRARDSDALKTIYQRIDALEPVSGEQQYFSPKQDYFHYPLAIALLLSLLLALTKKFGLMSSDHTEGDAHV